MSMNQPLSGNVSYADYLQLPEHERLEVLDGQVIGMTPSPTVKHQQVQRELLTELTIYLRGKECAVFGSPIDVCLFAHRNTPDDEIQDWLHPDLVVVCDKDKITTRNIVGAPDLVIEILSPSTARNDRVTKFHRYEKAGVKEYWIVDPLNEYIEVYERQESRFQLAKLYTKEDMLQTSLFEGLKIDLTVVFA